MKSPLMDLSAGVAAALVSQGALTMTRQESVELTSQPR